MLCSNLVLAASALAVLSGVAYKDICNRDDLSYGDWQFCVQRGLQVPMPDRNPRRVLPKTSVHPKERKI